MLLYTALCVRCGCILKSPSVEEVKLGLNDSNCVDFCHFIYQSGVINLADVALRTHRVKQITLNFSANPQIQVALPLAFWFFLFFWLKIK